MKKRHVFDRDWSKDLTEPLSELALNPNLPVQRTRMTLWRWATHGVEINGTHVKLPTLSTNGGKRKCLRSSVTAVREFLVTLSRLNGQSGDHWRKPAKRIKE